MPENKLQKWLAKSTQATSIPETAKPPAPAPQPAAAAPSSKLQKWLAKGAGVPAAGAGTPPAAAGPGRVGAAAGAAPGGEAYDPRLPEAQCIGGVVKTGFKSVALDETGKVRAGPTRPHCAWSGHTACQHLPRRTACSPACAQAECRRKDVIDGVVPMPDSEPILGVA